jgi:GTP 3',8-cyclase
LDELTLTTNGSLLAKNAVALAAAHVRRINVSLDSLDAGRFAQITRGGTLNTVLDGIEAARNAGIAVRINMVAMNGLNEADLLPIVQYCAMQGHDLALIETMPLGDGITNRNQDFIPLEQFIAPLSEQYALTPLPHRTAGPARYWQVEPLGLRLGLITPMSRNFCDDCNRLRLTTDGKIYMCLGSDLHVDLRSAIRDEGTAGVDRLLQQALRLKPERHDFERQMEDSSLRLNRHMNATGG